MPDFDSSTFVRSVAGQLLRTLGERSEQTMSVVQLGLGPRDVSALTDLERLGYVRLVRGAGALAWRVESVTLTDEGRARFEALKHE